jgi:hypothetical protein
MTTGETASWDGRSGTAGGAAFGKALRDLVSERATDVATFAAAAEFEASDAEAIFAGDRRVTVAELARIAEAVRLRAVEFLQRAQLLSLEVYALGLDPLYFLPEGQVRKDARIYMREINPRHAVPERDMLVRNPTLAALLKDEVLDARGKLEIEFAYLLRAAIQRTGGTL